MVLQWHSHPGLIFAGNVGGLAKVAPYGTTFIDVAANIIIVSMTNALAYTVAVLVTNVKVL